jgi:NAD-dependent dihydropyrimidine dehydrogenase PreA subunit
VSIDEDKCNGCGICVPACHEGAIQVIDGKARLVSDVYCDGLGDCLGECPEGAITIEERDAADFDAKAVELHLAQVGKTRGQSQMAPAAGGGCPGSALRDLQRGTPDSAQQVEQARPSQLAHWPVQLMLVPPAAPFLKESDLLVTADCVPFATANYHEHYLTGKSLIIGCPKLDDIGYYLEKLKAIFAQAAPRSVTVLKMEVPCCGGIARAVAEARNEVVPSTPLEVITIGVRGEELSRESMPLA